LNLVPFLSGGIFICPWLVGGYLGLSWGLPGGFLGVPRGKPLETPRKFSTGAH